MDFYVYKHIRQDTGAVFYIGKGSSNRVWIQNENCRNNYWYNIVSKCDYIVEIGKKFSEQHIRNLSTSHIGFKLSKSHLTNILKSKQCKSFLVYKAKSCHGLVFEYKELEDE